MALEDWENELRKQFEETEEKSASDKYVDSVPQQKNKIEVPSPVPAPVIVPVTENKDSSTFVFFVLLVIIGLATILVYDNKTGNHFKNWIFSSFQTKQSVSVVKEETFDPELVKLKSDIDKFKLENKSSLDAINAKLNVNSSKIGLMGLLLNENFSMIMKGADASDFIFFNRDWTLDRMPKYIELTEDDKEYLKKFVRPN
jgi:hypothetical protein